jgi:fructuronate reductase
VANVEGRARLSAQTLGRARADEVPRYDRTVRPRIVHIGTGAFARAHLGVYADDLLRQGWPATVSAVSLRSASAEQMLAPQDGLYTVEEQGPDGPGRLRVVGSITSAATGSRAAVEAIADPNVRMVTLTVTEKGYEIIPGADDAAPAVLAAGLKCRREAGAPPPSVVSLDNLSGNGTVLREAVLSVAGRLEDSLPDWIGANVPFPNSVVDRIVPAPTEEVVERVAARLGLEDRAAVTAEPYRSWVISGGGDLPPLASVGVEVVGDAGPYERRKLWLLNGPHSALAYCGLLTGCRTIAEAVRHPAVGRFVQGLVADIVEVSDLPEALDPAGFARRALDRFANPALGHTCVQVGTDGSRKLDQRVRPVVAARRERGLGEGRFALVVAIWVAAASGIPVKGRRLSTVPDPDQSGLRAAAGGPDRLRLVNEALGPGYDQGFAGEVVAALGALQRTGASTLGGPW